MPLQLTDGDLHELTQMIGEFRHKDAVALTQFIQRKIMAAHEQRRVELAAGRAGATPPQDDEKPNGGDKPEAIRS